MKNILLGLMILLLLAVGYLYYAFFSSNVKNNTVSTLTSSIKNDVKESSTLQTIAYIDMDSIQAKYDVAKTVSEEIKRKRTNLLSQIENLEKSYKNKLEGYQKRASQMSEDEMKMAGQELKNLEGSIMEKRQTADIEMDQFATQKSLTVKKKIEDFLKTFNEDKIYSFILAYEPGLFYYKDPSFDITETVIKGLNELAKKEKKENKK